MKDPQRGGRRRAVAKLVVVALVAAATSIVVVPAEVVGAATTSCTPDAGYNTCVAFTYSGSAQSFTVPTGVSSVLVESWGAGGGGANTNYYNAEAGGGAGGFATGTASVTPGANLTVTVGQGGRAGGNASTASTYGGGGAGGAGNTQASAGSSGGGLSGVFTGTTPTQSGALIIAAGGGGSSAGADVGSPYPGGGGGATGGQDTQLTQSGRGGTQTAGGAAATGSPLTCSGTSAGSPLGGGTGGTASPAGEGGGGGGAGYYGGGGGRCQNSTTSLTPNGAGGGGSSYTAGLTNATTTGGGNGVYGAPGTPGAAPNSGDKQYQSGVATGGAVVANGGNGGNGLVVIQYNQFSALTCTAGDIYSLDSTDHNFFVTDPDSGNQSLAGTIGAANGLLINALAITDGTGLAYAISGGAAKDARPTIYRYDPVTNTTTAFTGPALTQTTTTTATTIIAGAINPVNGIYYFGFVTASGGANQFEVYGFDTTTNTPITGRIATIALPANSGTPNGDIAFDRLGRMYLLATTGNGNATANPLLAVAGLVGSTGTDRTFSTKIIAYLTPNDSVFNGMAFDLPTGLLYVTGRDANSSTSFIKKINPSSGAQLATYTLPASGNQVIDAASCNYNNSLTVQKNVVNRAAAGDQFTVSVSNGGLANAQTATTAGTDVGLQSDPSETSGPVVTLPGNKYTISEVAANGASLSNYTSTYVCTNLLTDEVLISGTGTSAVLTFPSSTGNDGVPVGCTFTNSAYLLSLRKANPATLVAGQPSNYTFAVTNSGKSAAPTATVVDKLPANVAYTSASGAGWTCTATGTVAAGQTVTCTYAGSIAAGATNSSLAITVTPTSAASRTSVQNKAAVAPDGSTTPVDPTTCTANDSPAGCAVAAAQAVGTGALLGLTKSAPSPALVVGYPSAYTLKITNSGVNTAAGATVSEQLPANTSYSSASGATCTVTGGTTATGQQLTCTVAATIAANGGSYSFTVSATPLAAAAGASLTNRASVDTDGGTSPVNPATCTAAGTPAGCAISTATAVADVVRGPSPSVTTTVGVAIASIDVKSTTTSAQGKTIVNPTVATQPANGTVTVNADGTLRYVPNAGFSGADPFTYTICNNGNPAACDTQTVAITVQNVFVPGPAVTTAQNTSVTTPLSGIATTTGKPLDPTRVTRVTAPAHGTLSISASTGAVTYTPAAGYTGTDSYAVQVCDTSAPVQCTTITKQVTVGANTVTANDDTATTAPATAVSINVRGNDTTQTGEPLANPTITVAPTRGSVIVNADGTVTYTPTSGKTGVDSFTYRVCDTSNPTPVCATATVTVTVPNTVTLTNDAASTPQNTTVVVPLLGNDTVSAGGSPLDPATVTVPTAPTRGTVTINASTGAATYVPNNGYTGTDTFTYSVCDTSAPTPICRTATATITIGANTVTAVNDTASTTPGVAVSTNVRGNDTSSTGQPLALPTIVAQPGKGSVTVDPTTGRIVYTPTSGTSGVDTYRYQVCDTSNPTPVCATATVTVTVANTVTAVADSASTPQNTPVAMTVLGNDSVSANGAPIDKTSVSVTTAPAHGSTAVNATTGVITYTPANGYTGTDTYVYRVCDTSTPTATCATATATITVGANSVTANPDADSTTPGVAVTTTVRANDTTSTGQPLAVPTIATAPTKGSATVNANGTITYTPTNGTSGVDTYRYQVCDTSNPTPVCATTTVTITVANAVKANDDVASTTQNTAVTVAVLANDTVSPNGAPLAPGSVTVTTAPLRGTAAVNAAGTITYTPATGYTGTDTLTYRVCDTSTPTPMCSSAGVTITVGANKVTAINDTATTTPGTAVTTDVRGNDVSQTGQPLANPTVPTQPAKGTAVVNANGTITYTPNTGTSGTDSYTYAVCDTSTPNPVCSQATVTITVTNTVTAVNDTSTTPQNTSVVTDVLANDTVSAKGAPLAPSTVGVTTAAAHGATSINTTNGKITYTPNNGYTGSDSYSYTVCDTSTPTAVCATATVTIAVGGNTVTANADSATTTPGVGVGVDVRANDVTTTGQPLANPTIQTAPTKGTVAITAASGRIIYTPNNGTSGVDTFTYKVCDTSNPTPVCSTATVTITVVNTVTAMDDSGSTPQNTAVTTSVLANDTVSANGSPLRPAGVTVTAAAANGTTSVDATTGAITYTPTTGFSGMDSYRYQVCDGSTPTPYCSTATVTIAVDQNTVTAADDTATTGPLTTVTTDVRANDTTGTGQPLANPTVTTPAGHGTATVNVDGTISYRPDSGFAGIDTYKYRVCDTSTPTPVCATATVTVTVTNTLVLTRDTLTVAQNTAGTSPVLDNDAVVTGGAPLDKTSVTVTSPATNGTTTVNGTTGAITYTPKNGFSGTDVLTYQVCDTAIPRSSRTCAKTILTVTVTGNVVTAKDDSDTTTPGTAVTTTVLTNDTRTTGQPFGTPTIATAPTKGAVTVNADKTITYLPNSGTSGVDTYRYQICDTSNPTPSCSTATVTITVVNTVTAKDDASTTPQNTSVVTSVLANDTTAGAPLNPATVAIVTAPTHGTTSINTTTGDVTFTPTAGYSGTDTYGYSVCDRSTPTAYCGQATVTITVAANTVTARPDTATTQPGTAITVNVRGNDTSASGQALRPPTVTTGPTRGTATVDASGNITYTPTNGTSGTDVLTYQVCDTGAPVACGSTTLTITVPNTVTAVDDAATTAQNKAVTTTVLTNDTITANGAPLDPATVRVTSDPAHGTTSVNAAGAITYTPNNGYTGSDSYDYRVCDGSRPTPVCATATVTVTVGGNTVVAVDDSATTNPATAVDLAVRGNDTSGTGQPLGLPSVTTAPGHGRTAVNATTGVVTYTPAVGFSGTDTYRYQVCDTSNPTPVCASATVTITVNNTVTAKDDTATTAQNTAVTTPVLANDTVTVNGAPLAASSVTVTTLPRHGRLAIDNSSGAITYTPDNGYTGPDSYVYNVCDTSTPTPTCASATVTITVGGNTVTANADSATTTPGTAVTTDVRANDTTATGQPLGAPVITTNPTKGTVTVNANGTVTYQPTSGTSGTDTYVYQVCDTSTPTPVCSSATVTVTVANTVTAVADSVSTAQNTPVTVTQLANDTVTARGAPLDPASVRITTAPAHGVVTVNGDGSTRYTPANGYTGPDSYGYRVCDRSTPTPVCATSTVTVTVGGNTVSATNDSASTPPGTAVTVNVLANDSSSTGQAFANPVIVTAPTRGTATVNGNGTITYTPTSGTSGTDSLVYRACDTSTPTPVCATATLTISVVNQVTAVADTDTTAQNTAVVTPVPANDSVRPDGAPLDPASVTVTTAPAHGTTTVIASTGAVRYVPATGYSGTDIYSYRICDTSRPTPVCASAAVTITVGTNTVTAVDDTVSTTPGNAVSTNVRGNDTSATGQPLANPTVTEAPTKGTAAVNADGTITYTPTPGTSGRDRYTYRVCDTSNPTPVCATAVVTVNVPNVVTAVDDESSTGQNMRVSIPVLGNDTISTGGAPLDPASVTVTTAAAHGTTSVDTATGAIGYRPDNGYSGPDTFRYQVCDTSSPTPVCRTASVTVSVGANTVSAADDSDTTAPGVAVTTDVRANDSSGSGQPLAVPTVTTPPAHGRAVVGADGRITYTPDNGFAGTDRYDYRVCDTSASPICSTATVTISVLNVVTATNDAATVAQNGAVTVPVLTNDTVSPNGAPLNRASVTVTTPPAHGTVTGIDPATGAIGYQPADGYSGRDSFAYRVCDTSSPTPVCSSAQVAITVSPNTVTAVADTITTVAGTAVTVDLRGNDTSASGQPLAAPTITTQPAFGLVVVNADGTVTYTPATGKSGTDTFGYSICDTGTPQACSQNAATATVSVNNVVTATDDDAATPQNRPVTTPVLDNDSVSVGGSALDPASVSVTKAAANGRTSVNPTDGTITYTPNNGYAGPDSYDYRVCDSSTPTRKCATATVRVTVGGNTVVANDDSDTTTPGNPVTTDVRSNDSSASGQPFARPTITTSPANGTTTVNTDGTITYTPRDGTSGTDTYDYQVCDTSTSPKCATATVTITVTSSVTARPDTATVAQNGTVTVDVLANDAGSARGAPLDTGSVAVTTSPVHGQTTVLATGKITYTPDAGYTGPDTFAYRVCDTSTGTPVCASTTVSITVGANTVDAVDDAGTTAPGRAVTTDVRANDTSASAQPLAKPVVTAPPAKGSVVVNADGTITYTPTNGTSGRDTYAYRVCDTGRTSVCDTATVTIIVANTVTAGDDSTSVAQNGTVVVRVLANDTVVTNGAPIDPAGVTVVTAPQHGTTTVDTTAGTVTYKPAAGYSGTDTFGYRVCDTSTPTPTCDTATVSVSVGQNTVTAVDDSATTTPANPVSTDVRGNDSSSSGQPLAAPTIVTAPTKGTAVVDAGGVIRYTPNAGTSGVDTYRYRVCDTSATPVCATATVTVTVANTVTVVNDAASTPQNVAVTTAVLGNDSVTTGGAPLKPGTVTITTSALHGTTAINGTTGAITYTPMPGYSGPDAYTYTVCDGSTPTPVCGSAVVAISVGANAVAANDDSDTTSPGTPVTTDVRANDSSGSGQPFAAPTISTRPAHGTATVTGAGTITYTPDDGFSGVDTYGYELCDTGSPAACDTATVTISVPNQVRAVSDTATTAQNKAVTTTVLGNDTVSQNGAPLNKASVTVTGAPANGTTTVNRTTGAITYVPSPGFSGNDSYTYTVCDTSIPMPVCDSAVVTVAVGANTLTAKDDDAATTPTTPVRTDVLANDSSASGQTLADPTITTPPTKGSVAVNADGSVTYTPTAGTSGVDTYRYQVCDTGNPRACASATVTVTVSSVVTAVDDTAAVAQNASVTTAVLGNDTVTAGGAPLDPGSVTVTVRAAHGQTTVNTATGAITYVPASGYTGSDRYTYVVCDRSTPTAVCDDATVAVTVAANAVTATDDAATTTPGRAVIIDVTGNDRSASGQALADPTITVPAAKGSATVNADGTVTYVPSTGTSGTDTFAYRICDTGTPAVCASAVVTVTVTNTVTAVDDRAVVAQNGTVLTDVLGNDTVASGGAALNAGSVSVVTAPRHGTTSVDPATGAVTYTPDRGYSGPDSYGYRVCDTSTPTPTCDTATVAVTIGANKVTAAADTASTTPGNPVTTDVRGNDSSTSQQPLANPTVTTQPANGTVKVNPDGTITYTPTTGTSGTDTYGYQVCDTGSPAVCSSATVTVTVANTVTVLNDAASTPQNTVVTTAVLGNDSVSTGGAPLNPGSVTITRQPDHGSVRVNASSGAVTYTPDTGYSGDDSYAYQVCDRSTPTPVCGTAVVAVSVGANTVAANDDADATTPGTAVTTNVRGNDSSGSGQPLAAPSVATPPAHGTATVNGSGNITYVPNDGFSGVDSYTYRVCDTGVPAVCGTATVTVTVTNTVTAVADTATTAQNQPVTTTVLGNDRVTPDGAPLDPTSVTITAAAAHGTTTVNAATGAITYRPAGGFSGTDTYSYQVCDTSTPTVVCDVATVSVTVGGNTVTAVDDTLTTLPATPVTADVRTNDRSASGQPLGVPAITAQPARGTVVVNANGSISYTPNAGTSGTDTYGYRVCDTGSSPSCSTATVTVRVTNTVTAADDTAGTRQNAAVTTDVLGNDTTANGGSPLNPASVAVVTAPAHGRTTVAPSTGRITYVPDTGYSGPDTYRYSVCDGSTPTPVCDTATVTVTVGGNTVTASDDAVSTLPGNPVTANLLANDSTSTGQMLAPPTIVGAPAKGTVTVNPDGTVTYTPAKGTSGSDTFTYQVCDTGNPKACSTATATVTVSVVNQVVAGDDTAATAQNASVTTSVLANDTTSPDSAPLAPGSVAVTVSPSHGTTVVNNGGTITYTPDAGYSGPDTYVYRVCDTSTPTPVCDTAAVNVTVGGNAVAANEDTAATTPGTPVTTDVRANDSSGSGQPFDVPTIVSDPAKGSVAVNADGTITYTPAVGTAGRDTYVYRVCDTGSPRACSSATVTVTVTNTVTASPDTDTTDQNKPVTTSVLGNDTVSPRGPSLDPARVTVTTAPAHGTTAVTAAGAITYTPAAGYAGPDAYGYRVCDRSTPTPVCDTTTVTLTVGAGVVTARPDTQTTTAGTSVTTDVRTNDSSSTGQALDVPKITTQPAHGTVSVNADGTITYTPTAGTSGSDSYGYQVCDTGSTPACGTATVGVTVRNTVTANPDTAAVDQNRSVVTPVLGNDTVTAGGAPLDPASVTITTAPGHGTTSVDPGTGAVTYTPARGYSGPDSYGYRVCDTSSPTPVCVASTVTVTVGGNTVAASADTATTAPNTPVTIDVRANDSSSSGQPLTNPTITTPPARGTVKVNADGTVTYTPNPGTSGTDTFGYRVCDTGTPQSCSTATATTTITVANMVRVVNDVAATAQNAAVTTDVLDNDSVSTGGAALNPATVAVTVAPGNGSTTVNTTTGAITYTPAPGYSGKDSYTYRVCDGSQPTPVCGTATVDVTVGGNTVAANPDSANTTPGAAVTVDVRGNDSTSSGQSLAAPTIATQPAHGTVKVNDDGTVTYTPTAGTSGADSYDYRVCDTGRPPVCATATVTVTVRNTVTAKADAAATAQNQPITTDVLANDTVSAGGAPLDRGSVQVTSPANHGTTTVSPTTGAVTYTPAAGYSGPDSYSYQVCDTSSPTVVCGIATVSLTVGTNTVTARPDTASTTPGTPVDVVVRTNDETSSGQALGNPVIASPPRNGTAVVTDDGTITYTPRDAFSGTDRFTYQVCDTGSPRACGTATVTITVGSTVDAVADTVTTAQNTATTTDVLANDTADGAPLDPTSVAVVTSPAHGTVTVNATTGAVTYTPARGYSGADTYRYRVCDTSDPMPVCDTADVAITVGANRVAANDDSDSTTAGNPVTTDVRRNDSTSSGQSLALPTVDTPPTRGTAVVNPDGTITYTPRAGTSGTDSYTYRVCDTGATPVCDTATVTVTVDSTVTAVADRAATAQNSPVTTTVLSNDTVSDGGAPLDPASVTVTVAPLAGTTAVNANGTITYTPRDGFSGNDSYSYQVCDTSAPLVRCATAVVSISVGQNIVVASNDSDRTTPGTAVTTDVRRNDSSSSGQPLAAPTVTRGPAKGDVRVVDGTIVYTPRSGTSGTDTYDYRVCDTGTTPVCAEATVTITVTNTVTATADTDATSQNKPVTTTVRSNDTVSTDGAPLNGGPVTVSTAAQHGTAVANRDGTVTYTPDTGYVGTDSYGYTVCDTSTPTPVCDAATVTVTVGAGVVSAGADSDTTTPGKAVTTDVLDNDRSSSGQSLADPTVTTAPAHGTTTVNADGTITYTPVDGFSGTDTYDYRVCDTGTPVECATASVTVTVANAVTAVEDTATTGAGLAKNITVLENDTVSAKGAPLDAASVAVTTAPAHGTTDVNADGTVTYTPTTGYTGPDTFGYTVCDTSTPTPTCDTAVVSVTVASRGTVIANDDASSTVPGRPVITNVGDNDTSSSGRFALPTVVTAPTKGTATVNADGSITYTPRAGTSGADTYRYRICNTADPAVCDQATVTITVANAVTAADDDAATTRNNPVTTPVLGNDSASTGGAPLAPGSVTVTTAPDHGTTTVDADGTITYRPDNGYVGADSYGYRVCDTSTPTPVCGTATVTVSVGAGVAASNDKATTEPGDSVSIPVLGNDSSGTGAPLGPPVIVTQPDKGTAQIGANGSIIYTPTPGTSGTDSFTYRVCDTSPMPVCTTGTVTVTVANTVTAVDDPASTPQNTAVTTPVLLNDRVSTGGAPLNPASVAVVTAPGHGTTTVDTATGTITYTPATGFTGTDSYTYRVCDTSSPTPVCDLAVVTVTVGRNTVSAANDSATTKAGRPVTIPVLRNDSSGTGQPLTVDRIVTGPRKGSVTIGTDGTVVYTPRAGTSGTDTFTYRTCDTSTPTPVCATATVTVVVSAPAPTPPPGGGNGGGGNGGGGNGGGGNGGGGNGGGGNGGGTGNGAGGNGAGNSPAPGATASTGVAVETYLLWSLLALLAGLALLVGGRRRPALGSRRATGTGRHRR